VKILNLKKIRKREQGSKLRRPSREKTGEIKGEKTLQFGQNNPKRSREKAGGYKAKISWN